MRWSHRIPGAAEHLRGLFPSSVTEPARHASHRTEMAREEWRPRGPREAPAATEPVEQLKFLCVPRRAEKGLSESPPRPLAGGGAGGGRCREDCTSGDRKATPASQRGPVPGGD